MINLEWKVPKKPLPIALIKKDEDLCILVDILDKINILAKKNEICFYVTIPFFVYEHIIKTGINAMIDIIDRKEKYSGILSTGDFYSGDVVIASVKKN